jgi:hypothetical protein
MRVVVAACIRGGTENDGQPQEVLDMRAALMLIAVAALGVSFDKLVTLPSEDVGAEHGMRLAQSGPIPTAAVNPRLGSAPPGGHLGNTTGVSPLQPQAAAGAAQAPANGIDPADTARGRDATLPGNPAGRIGTIDGAHTGGPTNGAVDVAPMGAVAPSTAGAVEPPPGPNVRPAAPAGGGAAGSVGVGAGAGR